MAAKELSTANPPSAVARPNSLAAVDAIDGLTTTARRRQRALVVVLVSPRKHQVRIHRSKRPLSLPPRVHYVFYSKPRLNADARLSERAFGAELHLRKDFRPLAAVVQLVLRGYQSWVSSPASLPSGEAALSGESSRRTTLAQPSITARSGCSGLGSLGFFYLARVCSRAAGRTLSSTLCAEEKRSSSGIMRLNECMRSRSAVDPGKFARPVL